MIALYPGNFMLQSKLFSSSWLHSGCVCVSVFANFRKVSVWWLFDDGGEARCNIVRSCHHMREATFVGAMAMHPRMNSNRPSLIILSFDSMHTWKPRMCSAWGNAQKRISVWSQLHLVNSVINDQSADSLVWVKQIYVHVWWIVLFYYNSFYVCCHLQL